MNTSLIKAIKTQITYMLFYFTHIVSYYYSKVSKIGIFPFSAKSCIL